MKTFEPRIRYSDYTYETNDTDLPLNVDATITGMTGNVKLPDPPVPLKTIAETLTAYKALILGPGQRTTDSAERKKEKKALLVNQVNQNGMWVELTANGDLSTLRSSGYKLVERTTVTEVPGPGEIKGFATNGTGDLLKISCVSEPNVKLYEALVWVGEATEPKSFSSSTATIDARGLPQGVMLAIQIQKHNAIGVGPVGPTYKTRLPMPGEQFPKQPKVK